MKITEHFNKKIQLYSKQKRISLFYLFLIGITFSLPGMAMPPLVTTHCEYIDTPIVIKNNNCGPATCHGEMQCTINGIKYSGIKVHCEAKKAKLPRYSLSDPLPKKLWYSCPTPEECADPKTDRAFQIVLPIYYRISSFGITKKIIVPNPKDIYITPTLPPSKREEPKDTGSTQ